MEGTWMHRRLVISENYGDKLVHTCPFPPATLSSLIRTWRCAQALEWRIEQVGRDRPFLPSPTLAAYSEMSFLFFSVSFSGCDVRPAVSERPASCRLHYPAQSGQVYLPSQLQIIAERSVPLLVIMPHAL